MILWRNIFFFFIFHHFDSDPRFPPFLLYVRWKSGVTFVRRCFRDVSGLYVGKNGSASNHNRLHVRGKSLAVPVVWVFFSRDLLDENQSPSHFPGLGARGYK